MLKRITVYDENFLLKDSQKYMGVYEIVAKGGNTYDQFNLGAMVIIDTNKILATPVINNASYVLVEERAIIGQVFEDA